MDGFHVPLTTTRLSLLMPLSKQAKADNNEQQFSIFYLDKILFL